MTQWFYRINSETKTDDRGPVTARELLQLIREGVIVEDQPKVELTWAKLVQPSEEMTVQKSAISVHVSKVF